MQTVSSGLSQKHPDSKNLDFIQMSFWTTLSVTPERTDKMFLNTVYHKTGANWQQFKKEIKTDN